MFQSVVHASFCVVAGVLLQINSCLVTTDAGDSGGSSGSGTVSDTVRVRFVNESSWALDVQFYAAAAAGDAETVLFAPGNQITAGLGIAGSGLILAGSTDEIELACANALMIGTRGGAFKDSETGALVGTGQQRFYLRDQGYNCRQTITFIYKSSGDTFETSVLFN